MAVPVACSCGATYSLKDEFAGRQVRCPKCGTSLLAGAAVAGLPTNPQADPAFDRDRFLLRQKHFAISEKYYVSDEGGRPILFVQRPAHLGRNLLAVFAVISAIVVWWILIGGLASAGASVTAQAILMTVGALGMIPIAVAVGVGLAPKRHVTFYRDDTMREKLMDVLQDRKFYFLTATYTIRDAMGAPLAMLTKNHIHDLLRRKWICRAPDGRELCLAKEDSLLLALLRRFLGPLFGVLRTNFIFLRGEETIGEFNRKFTILDRYVLDLSLDSIRTLDRRVALALGVMLDTAERR